MSPNEQLFSKLVDLAQKLNESTEAVNATIDRFEEQLGELNLGVCAWVTPSPSEIAEAGGQWNDWQIGYGKDNGKWRILARFVEHYEDIESPPVARSPIPLRDAAREVRMELVADFDALTAALITSARNKLAKLDNATQSGLQSGLHVSLFPPTIAFTLSSRKQKD